MPFPTIKEFYWGFSPPEVPPAAGYVSFNSAPLSAYFAFDIAAATIMWVSNADGQATDATSVLAETFASAGVQFKVANQVITHPTNWYVFQTTGAIENLGTYSAVGIALVSSSDDPPSGFNGADATYLTALPAPAPTPPPSQANAAFSVRATLCVTDVNDQEAVASTDMLLNYVGARIVLVPAGETVTSVLDDAAITYGFIALSSDVEGVTWLPEATGFSSPAAEELRPFAFQDGIVWGSGTSPAIVLTNPTSRDAAVEVVWGSAL